MTNYGVPDPKQYIYNATPTTKGSRNILEETMEKF